MPQTPCMVAMVEMECMHCQSPFAMSHVKYDRCMESGEKFFCPNGHESHFGENKNARLKKQVAQLESDRDYERDRANRHAARADTTEFRRRAQVGVTTRLKNRIAKGVCPCCNRTFADLARHMKTKHPKYPGDE